MAEIRQNNSNIIEINGSGITSVGEFGTSNTIPLSGAGTRFVWYSRKGALRAGTVTGTQWDEANIGEYSVGLGFNSKATQGESIAIGKTWALGYASIAIGSNNESDTYASTTIGGENNWSKGTYYPVCIGGNTNISEGYTSIIVGGENSINSGDFSILLAPYNTNLDVNAKRTFALTYDTSTTTVSQSDAFIIYGGAGFEKKVGIQTLTPSATLDVNGTFTVASTATFNGNVVGINTDTISAATTGAFGTPYQISTTDAAFVTVAIQCQTSMISGYAYIQVKSDSSATPATIIATSGIESGLAGEDNTFTTSFLVKKSNYYQIDSHTTNGTITIKQWRADILTVG